MGGGGGGAARQRQPKRGRRRRRERRMGCRLRLRFFLIRDVVFVLARVVACRCLSLLVVGRVGRLCRPFVSGVCVGRLCRASMSSVCVGRLCRAFVSAACVGRLPEEEKEKKTS